MTKDVCLKWADDSREVQSVAGGITVQKQERQVSEPPLSGPLIYFSLNGGRRDFHQQRNIKREDLSLILSLNIRVYVISHLKKAIGAICKSVEGSESAPFAG